MKQNTVAEIEKIASKYNGEFTSQETRWFNGHINLPLHAYHLTINYNGWDLKMTYEFRVSEFTSPFFAHSGTFGDRHLFRIECKNEKYKNADFEIFESNYLNRLFDTKDNLFTVKSKNDALKKMLSKDSNLKTIFKASREDAEFSPLIIGKQKDQCYEITMKFNIMRVHLLPLESLIEFGLSFSKNFNLSAFYCK